MKVASKGIWATRGVFGPAVTRFVGSHANAAGHTASVRSVALFDGSGVASSSAVGLDWRC
ncbi:MAG: hypothetical protein ABR530_06280 [Pyrinomonadaceae bacterium]